MLLRDAARLDAEGVLREHWDDSVPVNPFEIARLLGITVKVTSLKPGLSGAIVADDGEITVLIEQSKSYDRMSFTCAHEIGHFMDRKRAKADAYSFVDFRGGGRRDAHEFYADEFAGNLLMPERQFREEIEFHGSELLTAATFAVSRAAVRVRRARLGI